MREKVIAIQAALNMATDMLAEVEAKLKIRDMMMIARAIQMIGNTYRDLEDIKVSLPAEVADPK